VTTEVASAWSSFRHVAFTLVAVVVGHGSSAAAWPLAARAQQGGRVRRIGVLIGRDENDLVAKTYVSAFTQALAGLGWTDGRNVRMNPRGGGGDADRIRALAQELVGSQLPL
jgi:putative ABC transport system substrate-binding protein